MRGKINNEQMICKENIILADLAAEPDRVFKEWQENSEGRM
jgi:hypothetical protein